MSSKAVQRYLKRHIEIDLPASPKLTRPWREVVVIPAFDEAPALLQRLQRLPASTLVILVLNRPDNAIDNDANTPLRRAITDLPRENSWRDHCQLYRLGNNEGPQLLVYDLELVRGPSPARQGVGLARKTGCDLALAWIAGGAINSRWIGSTDADARLPTDYFSRLQDLPQATAAAIFPFYHHPAGNQTIDDATARYELRLHQYALGLEYAGSPYAMHTLGSCVAISANHYAQVGGVPKRAGAEDFYLLVKLAKTGNVARLSGRCIALDARPSHRVPFGTGPAVRRIASSDDMATLPLYYHPLVFAALRAVLAAVPGWCDALPPAAGPYVKDMGLAPKLIEASNLVLAGMGITNALQHCASHSDTTEGFERHFNQWFDGFRTLKFIHGLREAGWSDMSLSASQAVAPALWPGDGHAGVAQLLLAVRQHWHWFIDDPVDW